MVQFYEHDLVEVGGAFTVKLWKRCGGNLICIANLKVRRAILMAVIYVYRLIQLVLCGFRVNVIKSCNMSKLLRTPGVTDEKLNPLVSASDSCHPTIDKQNGFSFLSALANIYVAEVIYH